MTNYILSGRLYSKSNRKEGLSHEAAASIPKMEEYIRLVQEKLTTLDFDMKRLALDMLNIKVWIDGQSVEVTGSIPVEDSVVATKSS